MSKKSNLSEYKQQEIAEINFKFGN